MNDKPTHDGDSQHPGIPAPEEWADLSPEERAERVERINVALGLCYGTNCAESYYSRLKLTLPPSAQPQFDQEDESMKSQPSSDDRLDAVTDRQIDFAEVFRSPVVVYISQFGLPDSGKSHAAAPPSERHKDDQETES